MHVTDIETYHRIEHKIVELLLRCFDSRQQEFQLQVNQLTSLLDEN